MTKRRAIIIIVIIALVCICPFLYCSRISTTFLLARVSDDAILSEYPEIEFTEKDAEWLESILVSEETQRALSAAENSETEFLLSDTGLEPFYQFPKDDCSISVFVEPHGHRMVAASFEPIVRDEKILAFILSISLEAGREHSYTKTLNVYKLNSGMSMTYDNIMARYWNFEGSFLTEIPALGFYFADMTLYTFKFPRAEILGK